VAASGRDWRWVSALAQAATPYARVTSADGFEAAFAAAVAVRGPAIVEVDVTAVGPTPVQFTSPVSIPGH
jgi:acetolactate synthase-1/2/3 large subunit